MGLAEMQETLARLYTDVGLRERFFADPLRVAHELGFSDEEARRLAELSPASVNSFAASLHNKRLNQVKKLLPLTARALGGRFTYEFRRYADAHLPAGTKKIMEDALGFSLHLGKALKGGAEPRWAADMLRYERARIRASDPRRHVVVCLFRHDISRLVRSLARKEEADVLIRPCAALWMRLRRGQTVRYSVIMLPRLRRKG